MQRILMILTSHRLDCFRLTMDSLLHAGGLESFDRVVLMLNGVVGKHLKYVHELMSSHPEIQWDTISGPRGKKAYVANLQNECVRRYPDALYFKLDEDLVVSKGWHEKLLRAYEDNVDDPKRALITPVVTNNAAGAFYLLNRFPELAKEYDRRFEHPMSSEYNGPFWLYPDIGKWMIRNFLNLEEANQKLESSDEPRYRFFDERFSINCLVYDYRHWQELGGIPDDEEPAWVGWVAEQGKHNIMVTDTLIHHYSFFVQQEWMDRSSLLEDLRAANVPGTLVHRHLPRLSRQARQIPGILRRRLLGNRN